MKFLWLDDWYPDAYTAAGERSATYSQLFEFCHGTSNYWDIAISQHLPHFSTTLILNHEDNFIEKAKSIDADVICSQNVGRWNGEYLRKQFPGKKLIGFCSYKTDFANLRGFDIIFSSFDWMPEECEKAGIRCEFLRLAFGKSVLSRIPKPETRDIDISFVGGLGFNIWDYGTATLNAVASKFPGFRWWGYQTGKLPESLERAYQGPAWGPEYFRVLMRSKLVINRHGEIARGSFRQNMREYEASGCGAYVLSDTAKWHGGSQYQDAEHLLELIPILLAREETIARNAREAQEIILQQDCYEHRAETFLEIVETL